MPKKKSSWSERKYRRSVELPASHEILSEHISRILNGLGQVAKDSVSLNGSNDDIDQKSSVEFALKQELEDLDTNCIYFFDEPKPDIGQVTIKVEPDQHPIKTEGMFLIYH